jgi:succinate dehydrogenase/fumarate reductase flavoprotein subunit
MAVHTKRRVIVVGGGLAGLSAAMRIAEAGVSVDLFSIVPVKRSHSVCAQGGINACNEIARITVSSGPPDLSVIYYPLIYPPY